MPTSPPRRFRKLVYSWLGWWRRRRRSKLGTRHVVWAYRLFLDREPEDRQRIEDRLDRWSSTAEMRRDFMTSAEFQILERRGFGLDHETNVVIKELPQGPRLFVDLSDPYVGVLIVQGQYETTEASLVRSILTPGQTAIDLGANIGYFSILMAQAVGPEGMVHSFEPLPSHVKLLRKSVDENGYSSRIEVVQAGVSYREGQAGFVCLDRGRAASGAHLHVEGSSVPTGHSLYESPVKVLDQYPLRRPIHFIKADIEGSEPLAFRGAEQILTEDRPVVLCEINPLRMREVSGIEPPEFLRFMNRLGYECCQLSGRPYGKDKSLLSTEIRSVLFQPVRPRPAKPPI